ncbi:MAG: hypothetical protein WBE39_07110 [Candidatus Competibacter sp.]
MTVEVAIRHLGRTTQATVRGGKPQLKKLRDALLLKGFVLVSETDDRLELRRRAHVTQDEWPMRVSARCEGQRCEIDYFLFIPWGWIAGFTALMWLVLPFAGVQHAVLAFGLGLVVLASALYIQKFDCRPNAKYWQARPRQRWHDLMEKLIKEAFARP